MNPKELISGVDAIARDRNLDKEVLYRDIEQAMVSAARKHFNADEEEDFTAELDRMTGKITVRRQGTEIPLEDMGRIPAQTAKQVMIQRFREDERAAIYNEYVDRVGELVTGTAQRYEGSVLIVQLGTRAEAIMPRGDQIPGEQHGPGERVRCLIKEVRDRDRMVRIDDNGMLEEGEPRPDRRDSGVKIVVSRSHPMLIRRLFEVEVPEVAERIIELRALAREPGHRTKVAVASTDSKVDAVGACVGVRGSRIKNIVDEMAGEKIDIVRWNESSQVLIQNALKPAEVREISLCFELGRASVVVADDQLSLAIGKRGQNVRLAAKLTKWDVDIVTPNEFQRSLDVMEETLSSVEGVGVEQTDRLAALGIISVFDVEEVGAEYLKDTLDLEDDKVKQVMAAVAERAKVEAARQAVEKESRERQKKMEQEVLSAQPGDAQAAHVLGEILPGVAMDSASTDEAGQTFSDSDHRTTEVAQDAARERLSTSGELLDDQEAGATGGHEQAVGDTGPGGSGGMGSLVEMLEQRNAELGSTARAVESEAPVPDPEDPATSPSGGGPDEVEMTESIQQGGTAEFLADRTPSDAGVVASSLGEMDEPSTAEASGPVEPGTDDVLTPAEEAAKND